MPHVVVLGLVLTLVAGVLSFAVLARKVHARPSRLPRSIATPLLLYNLWIAAWLVSQYLGFYLYPSLARPVAMHIGAVCITVESIIALAWVRAHLVLIDQFLQSRASRLARRTVAWFAWTFMALVVAGWVVWLANPSWLFLARLSNSLAGMLLFPIALSASILFVVGAGRQQEAGVRSATRVLGYAYVVLFTLITVLALVFMRFGLGSRTVLLSADLTLELAYNVLTVVWVARYADAFAAESETETPRGFDALCESFGITAREREIVQLICQGLTNREIASRLFISVGTVKDHNYTIFQKAGVRNRTKLAQLFSRPALHLQPPVAAAGQASNIRRIM